MSDMPEDPFAVEVDEDDPFASEEDVAGRSGPFVPWPNIEDVAERLVVVVPRKHDEKAKVSEFLQRKHNLPPEREEWRVDLIVLDGEVPFEYEYQGKVEGTEDKYETRTHRVESLPFLVPNWRVVWGNFLGAINKVAGNEKPLLIGRIRAGYNVKDMRSGKTFEEFAAERAAWIAKPKGAAPKPTWHFVVSKDAAEKEIARAWYRDARAAGFKL